MTDTDPGPAPGPTAAEPSRPGRGFDRSRLRLGIVLALVAGAIAFLLMQGLSNATTFFLNADEVVAQRPDIDGRRVRLQGTVLEGSVSETGDGYVDFTVEYHCETVAVRHQGDPPELFKPGLPVVVEGEFTAGSDTFESDRIIVKHTDEYREKESDRLELAEADVCP